MKEMYVFFAFCKIYYYIYRTLSSKLHTHLVCMFAFRCASTYGMYFCILCFLRRTTPFLPLSPPFHTSYPSPGARHSVWGAPHLKNTHSTLTEIYIKQEHKIRPESCQESNHSPCLIVMIILSARTLRV